MTPCPFTAREQEYLQGVIDGLSNREIGERLTVEKGTVQAMLKRMVIKIESHEVRNRVMLAVLALREGWMT